MSMLSALALGQEIVPVGEAATILYDNTSMNDSNGSATPLVVELGNQEGPTVDMIEHAF